jgi:hypothetical protein
MTAGLGGRPAAWTRRYRKLERNGQMNRKLKTLVVTLTAALALIAAMASAAQAQFTSNKEHTIYLGSDVEGTNDVFSVGGGFGAISCNNTTLTGTAVNKSESTMVITPTYHECSDTFGRTVDLDNSSLTYTFTSGANKGSVDVSGGMTLTVTSVGSVICTVVITSPQTNKGITYKNLGGTKGFEITTHATNVRSTTSGGFFNCGVSNGEHFSGTYDGTGILLAIDTASNFAEISVD